MVVGPTRAFLHGKNLAYIDDIPATPAVELPSNMLLYEIVTWNGANSDRLTINTTIYPLAVFINLTPLYSDPTSGTNLEAFIIRGSGTSQMYHGALTVTSSLSNIQWSNTSVSWSQGGSFMLNNDLAKTNLYETAFNRSGSKYWALILGIAQP